MSLRTKIALSLLAAVASFLGTDVVLRRASFSDAFTRLEKERASAELRRVEGAIQGVASELVDAAAGFSAMARGNLAGLVEGFDAIPGEPYPVMLLVDAEGWVLAHRVVDPATGQRLKLRDFPNERLAPTHPLLQAWQRLDAEGAPAGLLATTRGMVALGCLEVPRPGTDTPTLFAVGRFFDERLVGRVRTECGSSFDLLLPGLGGLTPEQEVLLAEAAATRAPVLDARSDEHIRAFGMIPDLGDAPVIAVRLTLERTEHAVWRELENYSTLTALAITALFPLILLLLLQAIVTGPLQKLTAHAVAIGRSDDASLRLRMVRGDEIGQLATEFDQMLEKLERSRHTAASSARLAGRSEIAVGVMHNVGTALNSVNVSAVLCRDRIHGLDLEDLQAIHEQLTEHRGELDRYLVSDPRGRHLLPFMKGLIQRLEADTAEAYREVEGVAEGVQRIVGLIASLRGMESDAEVVEEVNLKAQIEAAVELALSANDAGCDVDVQLAIEPLAALRVDRQRLLEVLVALLRNALQAVAEAEREFPSIRITARAEAPDDVCIDLTDNGTGIAVGSLERIFAMGMTTREGSSGVGLHHASLAAIAMGGAIRAASDGPGMGATFTVTLPRRSAPAAALPSEGRQASAEATSRAA